MAQQFRLWIEAVFRFASPCNRYKNRRVSEPLVGWLFTQTNFIFVSLLCVLICHYRRRHCSAEQNTGMSTVSACWSVPNLRTPKSKGWPTRTYTTWVRVIIKILNRVIKISSFVRIYHIRLNETIGNLTSFNPITDLFQSWFPRNTGSRRMGINNTICKDFSTLGSKLQPQQKFLTCWRICTVTILQLNFSIVE